MADLPILKADLNSILTFISLQLECDAQALIQYAAEDTLGGYHMDAAQATFPMGSLWGVEGQILYALIRQTQPDLVVEIGGWAGASASHLAAAVYANGHGKVISVDNYVGDSLGTVGAAHGALIPANLKQFVQLVNEDGRIWLAKQKPQSIGFIFEDADHSSDLVMELSRLALTKLLPGGILANHDAGHDWAFYPNGNRTPSLVAQNVFEGLSRAGAAFKAYLAAPSDCGLAITVTPGTAPRPYQPTEVEPQAGAGFPVRDPYQDQFDKLLPKSEEELKMQLQRRDFITGQPIGNAHIESESPPPEPLEGIKVSRVKYENGVMTEQIEAHPAPEKPITEKKPAAKKKSAAKKPAPKV